MLGTDTTHVSERLWFARELLSDGRSCEAEEVVEGLLARCTGLPKEDVVHSCGLSARLLALRGEQVRARMLAELAVRLACTGTPRPCQAYALLDQAYTLHTLGDCEEASARLRAALELAPGEVHPWLPGRSPRGPHAMFAPPGVPVSGVPFSDEEGDWDRCHLCCW
ncbi:tetratricopeptide repeat protein [Peterkaempfera sp. SMS 1(5)a]|uniref:tetratricopeptide repeat protein n=1 Tax=Peterkaempfera podocarpi TaxID=3232308 RepID=UPI003671E96C